jgi:hypothetical protein
MLDKKWLELPSLLGHEIGTTMKTKLQKKRNRIRIVDVTKF